MYDSYRLMTFDDLSFYHIFISTALCDMNKI